MKKVKRSFTCLHLRASKLKMDMKMTTTYDAVAVFLQRSPHKIPHPRGIESTQGACMSASTLHELSRQHAWSKVISMSDEMSRNGTSLTREEATRCAIYRGLALLQMRQLTEARVTLAKVSDGNVPFEVRYMMADVELREGDMRGFSTAYGLLEDVNENERMLVLSLVSGHHGRMGQFDAAIDAASMVARETGGIDGMLMLGRMYLRAGDVYGAGRCVRAAARMGGEEGRADCLHEGMLLAASGDYERAIGKFDEVKGMDVVCATNNAAVCLVQLGRVAEAVARLEGVVRGMAERSCEDGIVRNLGRLYDVAFPDSAKEKRRVLKAVVGRFGREGFEWEED